MEANSSIWAFAFSSKICLNCILMMGGVLRGRYEGGKSRELDNVLNLFQQ